MRTLAAAVAFPWGTPQMTGGTQTHGWKHPRAPVVLKEAINHVLLPRAHVQFKLFEIKPGSQILRLPKDSLTNLTTTIMYIHNFGLTIRPLYGQDWPIP